MRLLVRARNATIACEGDRLCAPEGRFDAVLNFPEADVRPGLINAHDHLHRNHYGRLGKPFYGNALQWAHDIQRRNRRRIAVGRRMSRRQAYLVGAWKNLFAGVTSVVHHDAWDDEFERRLPLRVVRIANDDSVSLTPTLGVTRKVGRPYALHLAEGTDDHAAGEIDTIERRGLLDRYLLAVHAVGAGERGSERLRQAGAALVWCPTSNYFLFGRSAPRSLFGEDMDVLLGSDSLLTAAGDLLDELRFARSTGFLDDDRLVQSVGNTAARRLALALPRLTPGAPADFTVIAAPLLHATADHVRLVVAAGVPRIAAPEAARHLEQSGWAGVRMTMRGVTRWANTRD